MQYNTTKNVENSRENSYETLISILRIRINKLILIIRKNDLENPYSDVDRAEPCHTSPRGVSAQRMGNMYSISTSATPIYVQHPTAPE